MNDSLPDASDPSVAEPGAPTQPDPEARYARQGLLGLGGMGRVFSARDLRLRRTVALKVAATPALGHRLAREAWVTAQLEHPSIVAVYDAGETDGQVWYTMRLIRGRTLRDRLADCPDLASRLVLLPHLFAAAQAVAYAHAVGIVHRDLKPSNIIVGEFGETQVSDWGLARPVDPSRPEWEGAFGAGSTAGTPGYMSPDQAGGKPATAADDVYALGAALVQLLGGQPPSPGDLPPGVPPELRAIAVRATAPAADDRYGTVAALADDLERWLSGRRVRAHAYRPDELLRRLFTAWKAPILVAAASMLVLAVALGLAARDNAVARADAERNLGLALAQQALAAHGDERTPEAFVLAAHALLSGPSPEARGVLASVGAPAVTLAGREELPAICRHTGVLSPDGEALACAGGGEVQWWTTRPLAWRATLPERAAERVVWVGERMLVATSSQVLWWDGTATEQALPSTGGLFPWHDGAYVVLGIEVASISPGARPTAFSVCASTRAATTTLGGRLAVGCDDGMLRLYDVDGAVVDAFPVGERPAWGALAGIPGALLTGRLDGGVQRLGLSHPPGSGTSALEVDPVLPGASAASRALGIREVVPVPGRDIALVLGDNGAWRLWNFASGVWLGALPGGSGGAFAPVGGDEVVLVGGALDHWRLNDPRPRSLAFSAGLSQADFSPDGTALAAALGNGAIEERALADGAPLRRWRWSEGVAKCVSYTGADHLLAGAMGDDARWLGPGKQERSADAGTRLRRCGRLGEGRSWALGYEGRALLLDPVLGIAHDHQMLHAAVDGSSSPSGDAVAIVDESGGVWILSGTTWAWASRVNDAVAVDIGDRGGPLVVASRREVCIGRRCAAIDEGAVDVAVHGTLLAIGCLDGSVLVLDTQTLAVLARSRRHGGRVSSVEFSPDGQTLASAGWDGMVHVWDLSALQARAADLVETGRAAWGLGLQDVLSTNRPPG